MVEGGMIAGEPHAAVTGDEHLSESGNSKTVITYVVKVGIFRVISKYALIVYEHPHLPITIRGDEGHLVADGFPTVACAGERFKAVEDIVVAAHTIVSANPDIPVTVFGETVDVVGRESEIGGREYIETPPVVAIKPMICSNPDKAPRILHDAAHSVVGQAAVRSGQVGEFIMSSTSTHRFRQCYSQQRRHKSLYDGPCLHHDLPMRSRSRRCQS